MIEVFLPQLLSAYLQAATDGEISDNPPTQTEKKQEKQSIMSIVIGIAFSVVAAYVSWSCNTTRGISTPLKVFYALFAFLFGAIYLIFYAIFVGGYCGPSLPNMPVSYPATFDYSAPPAYI